MSKELLLVKEAAGKVSEYFGEEGLLQVSSYEDLHARLTEVIVYMLLHKMEQLLSVLYRVDVKEHLVKQAFAQNDPKKIAPLIAGYIIDRELQKAESRSKYR